MATTIKIIEGEDYVEHIVEVNGERVGHHIHPRSALELQDPSITAGSGALQTLADSRARAEMSAAARSGWLARRRARETPAWLAAVRRLARGASVAVQRAGQALVG